MSNGKKEKESVRKELFGFGRRNLFTVFDRSLTYLRNMAGGYVRTSSYVRTTVVIARTYNTYK